MKILVLQLARLGDIYQTWPALRALRERYPEAQIDLLVRHRFRTACHGLQELNTIWVLQPREVLAPFIDSPERWQESEQMVASFVQTVRSQSYDQIYNLSFSPMSSFLCHALQSPHTQVCGYTRTSDGFLAIPDDGSAYFYAQGGLERSNRVHLTDLFGHICGLDLEAKHRSTPVESALYSALGDFVVIHVGASQESKSYGASKWTSVIRYLCKEWAGRIVLIGAKEEESLAEHILAHIDDERILNYVGQTSLTELFSLIAEARLLMGCDSAPIHMSSLTGTPCLNLSFDTVRFWETGPRSLGSRILVAADAEALASDRVAQEAVQILKNESPLSPVVTVRENFVAYDDKALSESPRSFEWNLIQSLYMGGELPIISSENVWSAFTQVAELNELAVNELNALSENRAHAHAHQILDRVDETLEALTRIVPEVTPVISWYQTEKIRLGPMSRAQLIVATLDIHLKLRGFLDAFIGPLQQGDLGDERESTLG